MPGSPMSLTPAHRPAREWPLLILAVTLVLFICVPLWQWSQGAVGAGAGNDWSKWTPERLSRLFLGPEQIACYVCCTWACFILGTRYLEVRRQRRAFRLELLPTDVGFVILPDDARVRQREVEQKA